MITDPTMIRLAIAARLATPAEISLLERHDAEERERAERRLADPYAALTADQRDEVVLRCAASGAPATCPPRYADVDGQLVAPPEGYRPIEPVVVPAVGN